MLAFFFPRSMRLTYGTDSFATFAIFSCVRPRSMWAAYPAPNQLKIQVFIVFRFINLPYLPPSVSNSDSKKPGSTEVHE